MNIDYKQFLDRAREMTKKGIEWHHHYLPPGCRLGKGEKHLIILESGDEYWQTSFGEKPMDKLEELENIFFRRKT